MTDSRPANPLEMIAYVLSKEIEDGEIVYIGTGLPMVAGILAKKTHAPNITLVYESGAQNPIQGDMPWSVGGPATWRKSPLILEMSYSFGQLYNGYVDKAFLGYAQIDMYGNVNTHMIGGDFHNYKNRLTGSGGNNDLSSLARHLILVGLQNPQKFVKNLDFMTSVGFLTGGDSREKAGLVGGGPMAVITSAGVYDFDPVSKRMRIQTLHPGVSPELAQLATGFELLKPEGQIPVTPVPTSDIIEILRREVDPRGVFTSMPS